MVDTELYHSHSPANGQQPHLDEEPALNVKVTLLFVGKDNMHSLSDRNALGVFFRPIL